MNLFGFKKQSPALQIAIKNFFSKFGHQTGKNWITEGASEASLGSLRSKR
jgi:hypothetical protein